MRSLLRLLFGKRLSQHPDSFALTREKLWGSIGKSIKLQQSMDKSVWLVVHFPETYLQCQAMLEQHDIDYHVETEPIDEQWFRDFAATPSSHVRLFLADLIRPLEFDSGESAQFKTPIAIMVAERHPWGLANQRLIQFAETIPTRIEVGHFLALDDAMVKQMVPEQMVDLLKTMGLDENDLISSSMVTRLINRRMRQTTSSANAAESANSAAEWMEIQQSADR